MRKKSDPPTRQTYLGMVISMPFIIGLTLWMQGDLTPQTATLTLTVSGLLCLSLRWIQDFFRAGWQQEYEQKLAHTQAELAREDLTAKDRRRLERYLDQLPNRFHLVTSPDKTYRVVTIVGVAAKAAASTLKSFWR
ncbi:hypothetical protein ACNFB1_16560 [Pseudomonas sp. NY15349]|uniref:hypothetical protein n=1 Tax=Pseudomonas sp. NY15349 TaxID=3400350 RepID=UPI003A870BFC